MSRKSKRTKKLAPVEAEVLSAQSIHEYILMKYEVDDNGFWDWFFDECPSGETNLLSLHIDDREMIQPSFRDYFNIILDDYGPDVNEESCLTITNDF